MSTELKTIKGVKECEIRTKGLMNYVEQEMNVTSYYGGQKNGAMIQITIGGSYVGLTKKQVKSLIKTLTEWL